MFFSINYFAFIRLAVCAVYAHYHFSGYFRIWKYLKKNFTLFLEDSKEKLIYYENNKMTKNQYSSHYLILINTFSL